MNWKYRGTEITLDGDGVFHSNVDGQPLEAPSLAALKTKIARCQDRRRKFDLLCWVAEVQGLENNGLETSEAVEIRVGLAKYTGYNLVNGTARLEFCDEDAGAVRTDMWDFMIWVFPVARRAELERPLALRRLEEAVEKYKLEREIFRERLEKIQTFRVVEHVGRENGIEIEAQLAKSLGGPAGDDVDETREEAGR